MPLQITAMQAAWFLPFVLPICVWVIWTDLSSMRIPNASVIALTCVFLVVGLFVLPLQDYPWRLVNLVIVLLIGILLNAAGIMGAGDSKFLAAAAPFIDPGDVVPLFVIFSANLLACFVTHRLVMKSTLRLLAPDWISWSREGKFPMGFALGSSLVIYLGMGIALGQ